MTPGVAGSVSSVAAHGAAAWAFLEDGFKSARSHRRSGSWEGCQTLSRRYTELGVARRKHLEHTLNVAGLDRELACLGGDPLKNDWRNFRPLLDAREEVWSDWLAFLLSTGDVDFRRAIFRIDNIPNGRPDVRREEVLLVDETDRSQGNYRSDILVQWTEPLVGIHVEVKVGDTHLEKTWHEARLLKDRHGGVWHHFLVVLPDQRRAAERTKVIMEAKEPTGEIPSVSVMTWEHVERELRSALVRASTPKAWLGTAHAFAGALGQIKLRRPVLRPFSGDRRGT